MTMVEFEEGEELVNPHATPQRLADAHRRLARVDGAITALQTAVLATYGPLLRDRAAAARTADLSERIAGLARDVETLRADFDARFPQPRPFARRVVERAGLFVTRRDAAGDLGDRPFQGRFL